MPVQGSCAAGESCHPQLHATLAARLCWGHVLHVADCSPGLYSLLMCAGTSLTMHYAMDDANDVLVAYKQVRGEKLSVISTSIGTTARTRPAGSCNGLCIGFSPRRSPVRARLARTMLGLRAQSQCKPVAQCAQDRLAADPSRQRSVALQSSLRHDCCRCTCHSSQRPDVLCVRSLLRAMPSPPPAKPRLADP